MVKNTSSKNVKTVNLTKKITTKTDKKITTKMVLTKKNKLTIKQPKKTKKKSTPKTRSNTTRSFGVNKVAGAPKRKVSSESAQAKKPKKRLKRFLIIMPIIILLLLVIFYVVNVNIKLLFDTETHITLNPSIDNIDSLNKTNPKVTFTTSINKLAVCDIICSFTLEDSSQNNIINITTVEPDKIFSQTLTLQLPDEGSGQSVFNYWVNCTTTDRSLCPSKGKNYTKSSFITVNYGLSQEEQILKDKVEKLLINQTTLFSQIKNDVFSANATLSQVSKVCKTNSFDKTILNMVLEWDINEEELLLLWAQEKLSEVQKRIIIQGTQLEKLKEDVAKEILNVESELYLCNQGIIKAIEIYDQKEDLENSTQLLRVVNNDSARDSFEYLISANNSYNDIIAASTSFSPIEFNASMSHINSAIKRILQSYKLSKELKLEEFTALQQELNLSLENNCTALNELMITITASNINQIAENKTNTSNLNKFLLAYCQPTINISLFNERPPDIISNINVVVNTENIPFTSSQCCFASECLACSSDTKTPVILIHGHSFSKSTSPELAFTRLAFLQSSLYQDGYVHAGTLNAEANIDMVASGDWGRINAPIVIGVTYYYLNYYDVGQLSVTTRKTDRIENYAIRLKESINTIREKTGEDEVILIAHSMGGLVARSYLDLFGEKDVKALIILGTPNHGIEGDIKKYCTLTGAKSECSDMYFDSPFIKRLNSSIPTKTDIYTIAAVGCPTKGEDSVEEGDGVVLARSVKLSYAVNYQINGTCNDVFQKSLHMDFVNPEIYPQTYDLIKEILDKYN